MKINTPTENIKDNVDDEIGFIEIVLFIQSSINSIVKSIVVCFVMGAIFYFYLPSSYEAKATLQMAQVANNSVETPTLLLEKIKLPLFFQSTVGKACGADGKFDSFLRIADKIKPEVNKVAPFISFTVKAKTTQEAQECLNAVVADIKLKQEELARPILETKKNELKIYKKNLKSLSWNQKRFQRSS